jgi:Tfp pilus assembly protein PilZ
VEKRNTGRARKRVMVRYGADRPDKTAFTRNISKTGLFVQTNSVFKPGTTLQLELHFSDRTFELWARVVWAKRVPPQLAHVLECGMGLHFLQPPAEWGEFFERWRAAAGATP